MTRNRRELIKWCGLSFAIAAGKALATTLAASTQALGSNTVTEDQRGDPDAPDEFVTFSPAAIEHLVAKPGKASFEEWDANLPLSMIATARRFVGYSRKTNPQDVSRFLGLFDLPSTTDRGVVPFCAAGLSYCALLAYSNRLDGDRNRSTTSDRLRKLMPDLDHYYFYPTVSCIDMYHIAAGRRRWVARGPDSGNVPKPGWLVLFDWKRRGAPDHCGIVQQATRDILVTIEFNTSTGEGNQRNGGAVAQKTRTYEYVVGFVVTNIKP